MAKVSRFTVCEKIAGDYLEFGVFRGNTFSSAYHALRLNFAKRIASSQSVGGDDVQSEVRERQENWKNMRFFAFDSFQGLPELDEVDKLSTTFAPGMYSNSGENFKQIIAGNGVDMSKVQLVKGWFEDTCTADTIKKLDISKAAIICIDSDLYSSAKSVLNFIPPLLQDGTVIIFDDWFANQGNPQRGEQRAFYEWIQQEEIKERFIFTQYHKDLWKRNSFIVSLRGETADQLGLPTLL